jgi:hypothetical protein
MPGSGQPFHVRRLNDVFVRVVPKEAAYEAFKREAKPRPTIEQGRRLQRKVIAILQEDYDVPLQPMERWHAVEAKDGIVGGSTLHQ